MSVFGKVILFALRQSPSQVFVSKLLLNKKESSSITGGKKETLQAAADRPLELTPHPSKKK